MELENEQWELWKAWAIKEVEAARANNEMAFIGTGSDEDVARFNTVEGNDVADDMQDEEGKPKDT